MESVSGSDALRVLEIARRLGLIEDDPATPADAAELLARLLSEGRLSHRTLGDLCKEAGVEAPSAVSARRWKVVRALGAGGMGEVVLARDELLGRDVALKFLHGDGGAAASSLLREARAQARVDHPHVCKVFEVGTLDGRSYVAMQLIDGPSLGQARELSLDDKLAVAVGAARGLHAAHEKGLIHRDLKPGNILVEQREGRPHPFVTDFGIALDLDAGATVTRRVVGTPAYMAPEQAHGGTVGRAADVYGLGATFYAMLSGRPPFLGNSLEVLVQLGRDDPPRLRRLDPRLPRDLATIVETCLAQRPERRYATAAEVADDLERYRDGRPIRARAPSLAYRAGRWLGRNRTAAGVTALALAVVATVTILLVRQGARRAEAARRFGAAAAELPGIIRRAYTLPLHDLTAEKRLVLARAAELEAEMARLGDSALGDGNGALGQVALALEDYRGARLRLESAWKHGARQPEIALALGLTLARQYQRGLEQTLALEDTGDRSVRRRELERTLRDPAVEYLRRGATAQLDRPEYLEALLAYLEGRLDEALALAGRAAAAAPWLYEAHSLMTATHLAALADGGLVGENDRLRLAVATVRAAADIARSDPELHETECAILARLARNSLDDGHDATVENVEAARACARALTADPSRASAFQVAATQQGSVAIQRWRSGGDPWTALEAGLALARRALQLRPGYGEGLAALSRLHAQRGIMQLRVGGDGAIDLRVAVVELAAARALGATSGAVVASVPWSLLGRAIAASGGDPRPAAAVSFRLALEALSGAPGSADASSGVGSAVYPIVEWEGARGGDWRPWLLLAEGAGLRTALLRPDVFSSWHDLAIYHVLGAMLETRPARALHDATLAVALLDKAVALNPKLGVGHMSRGLARWQRGRAQRALGEQASPELALAVIDLEEAMTINPHDAESPRYLGQTLLEAARAGDRTALPRARRAAARALELAPSVPDFLAVACTIDVEAGDLAACAARLPVLRAGATSSEHWQAIMTYHAARASDAAERSAAIAAGQAALARNPRNEEARAALRRLR